VAKSAGKLPVSGSANTKEYLFRSCSDGTWLESKSQSAMHTWLGVVGWAFVAVVTVGATVVTVVLCGVGAAVVVVLCCVGVV
jgi:hypothetical protein